MILKVKRQHKDVTENFDYTTIADRLLTVSWSNYCHPNGVVKPVYGIPNFQLTAKAVLSKGRTLKYSQIILRIKTKDQQPIHAGMS